MMTNEIEANERDGFAFTVDGGKILDARSEIERVWEFGEMPEEAFGKATGRGENEIGFAGEGFERRVETASGGLSGEVDGYDNSDSESDGEHSESSANRLAPEWAEDETGEE
jgi:hypothetical protein